MLVHVKEIVHFTFISKDKHILKIVEFQQHDKLINETSSKFYLLKFKNTVVTQDKPESVFVGTLDECKAEMKKAIELEF